jgi:PAS domain S-box-containing protein
LTRRDERSGVAVARSAPDNRPDPPALADAAAIRLAVLEALVEATDVAMFSTGTDARIVLWNRAAVRVFGYEEEAIVGAHWTTLFPEHLADRLGWMFDAIEAGDRVEHSEIEGERRDGNPVHVSVSLRAVHQGETSVGMVGVLHDITEQRLAQGMLAEAEARLREGEALAHTGRWQFDVASRVVQWSDGLHALHGVDPLEFGGTLDAQLGYVHPDDVAEVRSTIDHSVTSGRAFDQEYRIVRPDEEIRWLQTRAEPTIDSGGNVVALRGIAQDVTDRHIHE